MKIKLILEILKEFGEVGSNLTEIFLTGYHTSYKNARRRMKFGPFYNELFNVPAKLSREEYLRQQKKKFYDLLYYLQKEGLVEKQNKEGLLFWKITKKGAEKLKNIKKNLTLFKKREYKIKKNKYPIIIIFDIPEVEKRKRVWLRENLLALGFSMLQKSVWIGENKLPTEFIDDLKHLSLLPYIEIFSVMKMGTITNELKFK